eukprot:10324_1
MSTPYSFLLLFWCILISTNLDTCSSNPAYPNELCSPDNWMSISGDWSFTNPCAITNAMGTNNIAILPYKSWTYLNTVQDPSYQLDIEYNFTITSASANNTIGSVGVIWFPDVQPDEKHDYMGVSFEKNEAFAVGTRGLDSDPYYDNTDGYMSNEHLENGSLNVVWKESNSGALPLQLSVNTLYSLRMEIYSISDRYANHDIYINNKEALSNTRTYTSVFEHNTSWIGLKSSNVSVISHSLTVYQSSTPDSGDSMIDYFTWTDSTTGTPQTSELDTTEINLSTTNTMNTMDESTLIPSDLGKSVPTPAGDESFFGQLFNMDIVILVAVLALVVLCICVCGAAILTLLRMPNKKVRKDTENMIDVQVDAAHTPGIGSHLKNVQREGETGESGPGLIIPSLPKTVSDVYVPANNTTRDSSMSVSTDMVTTNGAETEEAPSAESVQSGEMVLKRMYTPDGQTNRGVSHCGDCGVALMANVRVFVVDGVRYCGECKIPKEEEKEESSSSTNELYDVYNDGEELCHVTKTFKGTLGSDKKAETVKGCVDVCEDCGESTTGKKDNDGSFFCNECWKMYENENNTSGFIK